MSGSFADDDKAHNSWDEEEDETMREAARAAGSRAAAGGAGGGEAGGWGGSENAESARALARRGHNIGGDEARVDEFDDSDEEGAAAGGDAKPAAAAAESPSSIFQAARTTVTRCTFLMVGGSLVGVGLCGRENNVVFCELCAVIGSKVKDLTAKADDDITLQVAAAPRTTERKVQSLRELEGAGRDTAQSFASLEGLSTRVDLSLLTSTLLPPEAVAEADELWEFDRLLTEIAHDIRGEAREGEGLSPAAGVTNAIGDASTPASPPATGSEDVDSLSPARPALAGRRARKA